MKKTDFDYDLVSEGGKDFVKVLSSVTITDDSNPEIIIDYTEGYTLTPFDQVKGIVEDQRGQMDMIKKRKTEKIILTSEQLRIREAIERINKARDYENKVKAAGENFDRELEKENKSKDEFDKICKMWREIHAKVERKIKERTGVG